MHTGRAHRAFATLPPQSSARAWTYAAWAAAGAGASVVTYLTLHRNSFREEGSEDQALAPVHPPQESTAEQLLDDDEPNRPRSVLQHVGLLLFRYLIEPILVTKRFLVLALLFGPVILTSPMLFVGKSKTVTSSTGQEIHGERWGALWWYGFLVAQMGRAGPTFVKLGQWAGSRHDLFPDALCDRFAKLHSNNNPHSIAHTKRVLEHVFKKPFDEIFESFETDPVGVGAVGQVYKAVLRSDLLPDSYLAAKSRDSQLPNTAQRLGKELALTYEHDEERRKPTAAVAIKILHPNVRRTIGYDIKIMRFFADTINTLPGMNWVSLPEEVQQFSTLMFSQLDLRHEANNLARFERNFAKRNSAVSFPRPLLDFCSKDVLMEEMVEAVPLKHFMKLGGLDYDARIAELGLDAFLVCG